MPVIRVLFTGNSQDMLYKYINVHNEVHKDDDVPQIELETLIRDGLYLFTPNKPRDQDIRINGGLPEKVYYDAVILANNLDHGLIFGQVLPNDVKDRTIVVHSGRQINYENRLEYHELGIKRFVPRPEIAEYLIEMFQEN